MRFLIAIALALGIAAVAYGAAASLTVDGGVVQYGVDAELRCDTDGVIASATTRGASNPTVDFVSVQNLDAACAAQKIRIGLSVNGNTSANEAYNGLISAGVPCVSPDDGSICFPVGGDAAGTSAEDLTDIHLTIYSE